MAPIVNWEVGWWEATQTCAKKGDNEFRVGNSEETRRKHLDIPIRSRNETDPYLISLCGGVFSPRSSLRRSWEPRGNPWDSDSQNVGPGERGGSHRHTYT